MAYKTPAISCMALGMFVCYKGKETLMDYSRWLDLSDIKA